MRPTLLPAALLAVALAAPATDARAALLARNLDGDPSTVEAYYDTALDITWLADPELARKNNFGLSEVGASGAMDAIVALRWIDAMNQAAYLGYADWRLPRADPLDGVAHQIGTPDGDVGYGVTAPWSAHPGSTASEMAHLFYNTLGNPPLYGGPTNNQGECAVPPHGCLLDAGPFVFTDDWFAVPGAGVYWSANKAPVSHRGQHFVFDFGSGHQGLAPHDTTNLNVWAVRDGDVAQAAVPEPGSAALLGAGLLTLGAGVRRRATRPTPFATEHL